jgi:hypothetical protein
MGHCSAESRTHYNPRPVGKPTDRAGKINDELGETNRGVVALYDELDTVQQVGRVVASKLDLAALLQAITDATVEVSGAECGAFFRKELQSPSFTCQTVSGPLGIALQNCSLVNIDELTASGTDQQIIRVDDFAADNRPFQSARTYPFAAFLPSVFAIRQVKLPVRLPLPIALPAFSLSAPTVWM